MSLQKFKTFEDAEKALWIFNPNKEYYRQISDLFATIGKLCPLKFPNGIFKYKTFEEAEKQSNEWLVEQRKNDNIKS